jgi:hypothetical protein
MEKITIGTYKIVRINGYKRLFKILEIKNWTGIINTLLNKRYVVVEDVLDNDNIIEIEYNIIEKNWKLRYWYNTKEEAIEQFDKLDEFYQS